MRRKGIAAFAVRGVIVALGALVVAFAVPPTGRAGAPVLTTTINFADYGNFISELDIGTVPAGTYKVSLSSSVPIALFGVENEIYFSGSSYFPDGTYMGGDEGVETATDFSVDPQALGKPYADTKLRLFRRPRCSTSTIHPGIWSLHIRTLLLASCCRWPRTPRTAGRLSSRSPQFPSHRPG
jgi:hypothetical protein